MIWKITDDDDDVVWWRYINFKGNVIIIVYLLLLLSIMYRPGQRNCSSKENLINFMVIICLNNAESIFVLSCIST